MARPHRFRSLTLVALAVVMMLGSSCASSASAPSRARQASERTRASGALTLDALQHATFRWVSAQCIDGVLDLAAQGFERTLTTERVGSQLLFTYETELASPQCASTEMWTVTPLQPLRFQFLVDAEVALPAGVACGAPLPRTSEFGALSLHGDTLEELHYGSAWCRGFDARFVYQRTTTPRARTDAELIRHYVAHWNRRDARAISALFAERGVFREPFSRSVDGLPVRHEGREAIEAWFTSAFSSVPWLALQLSGIEPADEHGQRVVAWRYFDPALAEPLQGRNLFVLAGGEIFATELQVLSEPAAAED